MGGDIKMNENDYNYGSTQVDTYGVRDNFNPFDNETEYKDYNSDYRKIVPQIAIKNCQIPCQPSDAEKRKIRHYFNVTGWFMVGQVVLVNLLASGLMIFLMLFMSGNVESVESRFMNSSLNMAITGLCYMITNIIIFLIGCKVTDIDKSSLFKTQNLKFTTMLRYIVIAIFLQMFSAMSANFISTAIDEAFGVNIYAMLEDTPVTLTTSKLVVTIIYTCIIAPITEELVIRGFVLKNLSRVSQTFGIVVSSIVFALMHENLPQFILAFIVGVFLGYVAVKHNSIVPTIILHMIVNSTNMIISIIVEQNAEVGNIISAVWTVFFLVVGVALFIVSIALKWDRLPKSNEAQKKRGVSLLLTSPGMLVLFIVHTALTFIYMNM